MQREITSWYSPSVGEEMPIVTYGDYGFALLLLPTAGADYLEYERFHLMDDLAPIVDSRKVKVFSINSLNKQSWMNKQMEGAHKAIRQNQFNEYVWNEVIPFIKTHTSPETPIIVSGASFGALHSMNLFLKRPDLIDGVISMSGVYNLMEYTDGYYDDQVYYNSPAHYMPNLEDPWYLDNIRRSQHIHIFTGEGAYEAPWSAREFSNVLNSKGIGHDLNIWGHEWTHDWPTWRAALPYFLWEKF